VGCPRLSEKPRAVLFVPQSDLDLGVLVHHGLALRRQIILGKVMHFVSSPLRKKKWIRQTRRDKKNTNERVFCTSAKKGAKEGAKVTNLFFWSARKSRFVVRALQ